MSNTTIVNKKSSKKLKNNERWYLTGFFAFVLFLITTALLIVIFSYIGPFQPNERNVFLFLSPFVLSFTLVMILLWQFFHSRKLKTYILFCFLCGILVSSVFTEVGLIGIAFITNFTNVIAFNRATNYCGHLPVIARTPLLSDYTLLAGSPRPYYLPGDPQYHNADFLNYTYFCTEKQAQQVGDYRDTMQW